MAQVFGVLLILASLLVGYDAYKAWQGIHALQALGEFMSAFTESAEQDALFQSFFAVVMFVFGVTLLDD